VERLVITLLADGHPLMKGAPGLARAKVVKALASGVEGSFHRIQFTPDVVSLPTLPAPKSTDPRAAASASTSTAPAKYQ
jgi:hypothetical protein